jgi:broad specificity phosphatase PhoE
LSYEGINAIIQSRDKFWKDMIGIACGRPIRVFVSPLKRSIQTCLISMKNLNPEILRKIKVTVTPIISETGNSAENKGMLLEALEVYPSIIELRSKVKSLNFTMFSLGRKWWDVELENNVSAFTKHMRRRKFEWNNNECIVCFTHWGFVKRISGINLSNFGIGAYYVLNSENSSYCNLPWMS